jgi:hypothetical protein
MSDEEMMSVRVYESRMISITCEALIHVGAL